jgi:SPX domain protein involved in polyphosphate accumulation
MSVTTNKSEELRYERKFLITDFSVKDVEQMIKLHPARFSEIYYERVINNIYLDTLGFSNYYDNVEGETERLKARIRWYGELFGTIENPVLEFKIKKGLLGKKESYPLLPFVMDTNFSKEQVKQAISATPPQIRDLINSLKPALLNRYTRKYFISADGQFRITIDSRLTFYRIGYVGNTFLNKSVDYKTTVLELKYDSSMEVEAKQIGNMFPFALTKSSKYLQGIEKALF